MRGPEVEDAARIVQAARGHEGVAPRSACRTSHDRLQVRFANTQHKVRGARELLADPRVPPAELEVRARRSFAEEKGVARAVGRVEETRGGVLVEHPVACGDGISPRDAEVRRERGPEPAPLPGLRRSDATIHRADECWDDDGEAGVRRVVEWKLIDLVSGRSLGREGWLFDERKDGDRPAGVRHAIGMIDRTVPGWKAVARVVVVVEGESELLDAVLAIEPRRRGPHLLHRGEQKPDQDRNDRDDDEELDEGEGTELALHVGTHLLVFLCWTASPRTEKVTSRIPASSRNITTFSRISPGAFTAS